MTDQDTTLLIQDIITRAQEGRAFPFRTIRYWGEFKYFQRYARSTKIIIRVLRTSANNLFKDYCSGVIAGISDITKLLAYQQMLDIVDFYKEELETIQAMLTEYDEYLGDLGNFVGALFGERRDT
jgi:hypothetical protein